ncbi:MAG TPA: amylo-alpha-1,6-glucosidase [Candidatus Eisenbacteria bacterium]|nr:amylo-alpha-1,6-glucosidase [Candidatus Eisenbacteria bacterium]
MALTYKDVIRFEQQFYILASSSRVDDRTRVLKQGETFTVLDRFGEAAPVGLGELGLYHRGTRYLSRLALTFGRDRPLLLSSNVNEDNTILAVDLTNPDLSTDDDVAIRRSTIHVSRELVVREGVLYERMRVGNYGLERAQVQLVLHVDADFVDLFEVRGFRRARRGDMLPPEIDRHGLTLGYQGLDGVTRRLAVRVTPAPTATDHEGITFDLKLPARSEVIYEIDYTCRTEGERIEVGQFESALEDSTEELAAERVNDCGIESGNEQFNEWIRRSYADLHLMITETAYGPYPYAGVPWFNTPFGRDGIITALQTLWVNPAVAKGVLRFLAAMQATTVNDAQDAQPGKILHESRMGEVPALGEVPFARYYGSADATPLFVILAGAYFDRTDDRDLIEEIWTNIEAALAWMEHYGDRDGDGFVEYWRQTPKGLTQQGWKDSWDSVFHADGKLAQGPIALCEVQGYVYAARRAAARLARARGDERRADELVTLADSLRERFEKAFWDDELRTYALALDGEKRPCRVVTSNPGHCLYSGIASPRRARRVMRTLFARESFSGWGIRTVAATAARYNPMAYHNGSVWPHDNAMIAAGFARYGFRHGAKRVLDALFDASLLFEDHRLPELFCGFARRPGEGPTLYPVACSPQSWAAAAPFMLLQATLGLTVSTSHRRVTIHRPSLPERIDDLRVRNLRVGDDCLDLVFLKHPNDVGIHVERRTGKLELRVTK